MAFNNGDIMGSVMLVQVRQLVEARSSEYDWTVLENVSPEHIEKRKVQTQLALRSHRNHQGSQTQASPKDDPGLKSTLLSTTKYDPKTGFENSSENTRGVSPINDLCIPPYRRYGGEVIPAQRLYPISRDHLMPLVEYNVFRATATNYMILGPSRFSKTCPFGAPVPIFASPYQGLSIPASLERTPLQQSAQYPAWIDLLPSPRMRDNAIRSQHLFTSNELCADILGGLMGRQNDVEFGLIAWSNPWVADGWELTDGFVRKWAFLVRGCVDLFEATNRWRGLRGEEGLISEL